VRLRAHWWCVSLLLGTPGERLSLARAVDALSDSARRAGRPSFLWLAGVLYPSLNLNFDVVRGVLALVEEFSGIELPWAGKLGGFVTLFAPGIPGLNLGGHGTQDLEPVIVLLPIMLIACRLNVGLARVSDPLYAESSGVLEPGSSSGEMKPRPTRLRQLWREGKGLGLVAFGLWGMLLTLLFGAMLVLIAPVVALLKLVDLAQFPALSASLLMPVVLLILAYTAILMVLNQLALHSLAHNRRGVASALTHAWRLVRASPLGTVRAALVDFVLFLSVLAADVILSRLFPRSGAELIVLGLYGFAGVTRAAFWARSYRALGGLSQADHVPGL